MGESYDLYGVSGDENERPRQPTSAVPIHPSTSRGAPPPVLDMSPQQPLSPSLFDTITASMQVPPGIPQVSTPPRSSRTTTTSATSPAGQQEREGHRSPFKSMFSLASRKDKKDKKGRKKDRD